MYQVAICIINFNTYEKTFDCISAIQKTMKSSYKIFLLDNGSANDSVVRFKEAYKDNANIELVCSQENMGYARGNNLLLQRAKNDGCVYSVIMNNDVICLNPAIDIMLDVLQRHKDFFLVGPKMFGLSKEIQTTAKREKPNYNTYLKRDTMAGRLFPHEVKKETEWLQDCKTVTPVYWLSGAIFAVRMSDFEDIGFFDEFTFLYFEEYILSEKALASNRKMAFVPQAEVLHFHGASTGNGFNFKTRCENWRSEVYFLRKYYKISMLRLWLLFVIRIFETFVFGRREKKLIRHLVDYVNYGIGQIRKERKEP